jgi:hypothetical protein
LKWVLTIKKEENKEEENNENTFKRNISILFCDSGVCLLCDLSAKRQRAAKLCGQSADH